MAAGHTEPSPRARPFSSAVEGLFYVWGGALKFEDEEAFSLEDYLSTVHTYDPNLGTWSQLKTTGAPPSGIHNGACASTGHYIYTYGGNDTSSASDNSLYQLDTRTLVWTRLPSGPMRKGQCGMIAYDNKLLLFGGEGIPSGPLQPGSEFILDVDATDGSVLTNELHVFDFKKGVWSSPVVSGTRPPPCGTFSLTMIDDHRAVLFGGFGDIIKGPLSDAYIIDLTTMHWSKLDTHEGEQWPKGRGYHAAVCLGYGSDCPQLLVTGGVYEDMLNDAWLLDVNAGKWTEVKVPDGFRSRSGHCAGIFQLSPALAKVVIFGGCSEMDSYICIDPTGDMRLHLDPMLLANTTLLRLEKEECASADAAPTSKWALTNVATNSQRRTRKRVRREDESSR